MKKKIGLLLATVMVLNTMTPMVFAEWKNPLKEYNLYEDTHPQAVAEVIENNPDAAKMYAQAMGMSGMNSPADFASMQNYGAMNAPQPANVAAEKTRNETLRESSRNVYSDPEATPDWESGPSYYPEPSLESIIEKYHRSDFAGCLQECISFVRQNPYDTLGFYYLAMSYTKVNDKDNAVMAYEKVIALNDNPMIVKYATNGRNCIMGVDSEACYQNVNEPELLYPYKDVVQNANLTPIDPEVLVNRNLARLKDRLSPYELDENDEITFGDGKDKKIKVILPFGKQDAALDEFVNAPYGDGFSPELKKQYKQLQLRKIMDTINTTEQAPDSEATDKQEIKNLQDIQKFDDKHSDSGMVKLAYAETSKMFEEISKDPEFIRQKQELEELQMMFGSDRVKSDRNDIADLIPYMSEQGDKKLSPEVIQSLMMQSMMGNLTL